MIMYVSENKNIVYGIKFICVHTHIYIYIYIYIYILIILPIIHECLFACLE